MKRSLFLKSLFAIALSPKILAEIEFKKVPAITGSSELFKNLQLLTPSYYKSYVEKYGSEDFTWWLNEFAKGQKVESRKFHWFQTPKNESNQPPSIGESVTITIKREDFHA